MRPCENVIIATEFFAWKKLFLSNILLYLHLHL